jgi:predicted TIM-barrel fold metal-dependent hydrolase
MTTQQPPIIDAHVMLGVEYPLSQRLDELLRKMDQHGVEKAAARPMGGELVYFNSAGNDRLLAAGPRILALVTANPWRGDGAVDELKRCRQSGAVGLFLHPARQGFMPIEPVVEPLLDFAAEARWPVMFHTGTFVNADVLAVAEVARRYPQTSFILGCGGFADMWFEIPGVMETAANVWLETSHILGNGIRTVMQGPGANRVVFGSGEPSNRYACALKCLQNLDFNDVTTRRVLRDNARRLFNLS